MELLIMGVGKREGLGQVSVLCTQYSNPPVRGVVGKRLGVSGAGASQHLLPPPMLSSGGGGEAGGAVSTVVGWGGERAGSGLSGT